MSNHFIEASIQPVGKEWEVTIVGATHPDQLVTIGGREYVRSKNGRLYAVDAIEQSVAMWEGVKVYDDHMTNEEFTKRQGMRSPKNEWLGSLVNPRFVRAGGLPQLRAVFKVVEDALARKLKNAWDAGILNTIGLSLDAFTDQGNDISVEGKSYAVVEAFKSILSVDLVGNPAAGGGFVRLLAAAQEENDMSDETGKADSFVTKEEFDTLASKIDTLADALAAKAEEAEEVELEELEELEDEEVLEALAENKMNKAQEALNNMKLQANKARKQAEESRRAADLARTELMVDRKLEAARLPDKFEDAVRAQFAGRIVDADVVDAAIKHQREAYASLDPSGRVKTGGIGDVKVGVEQNERFELEFMRRMMGETAFRQLEHIEADLVTERLQESKAYRSWLNNGKPDLPRYNRMSSLIYEYLGGDPLLDPRAMEAATTSNLATVVKNTVNIMTANSYAQRELWWEAITRTEEVDTIDDATLARVYGVDTLDIVNEGGPYTEIALQDEEETASFVKHGNYIGVTLETMMRDKLGEIRRIPEKLAAAWYNTQSDLVANVFTVNSAAGPVLSDSGALFNNTATSTPGGHTNLLTTALGYSAYSAARTAMRKQTDQPLGVGRKLMIRPRYLLVPVDLETEALQLRNSELYPGADFDAADSGAQTRNIFAGEFDVIVVPSWTDATDWALVADPAMFPAIWLIYPRGQRTPQIFGAESETGGSMFTNDEMRFKVRLMTYRFSATYDCAPVSDWRPLHKSNVAG